MYSAIGAIGKLLGERQFLIAQGKGLTTGSTDVRRPFLQVQMCAQGGQVFVRNKTEPQTAKNGLHRDVVSQHFC
jgi:hypothetical protein